MYQVKKRNRRLIIVDDNDKLSYTMPDFIRNITRPKLQELCDKFNETGNDDIKAIIEWETKYYNKK